MKMKTFWIRYGLGGGFGGLGDWEQIEAPDEEEAFNKAFYSACEVFDSYDGMHGIQSVKEIMKDEDLSYDQAYEAWLDQRESWIEYEITDTAPEEIS